MQRHPSFAVFSSAALALLSLATPVFAQSWDLRGVVLRGEQIDAVAGPDGRIHLVADRYHQIDRDGNVVLSEVAGDPEQNILWAFMYPPALSVAPDGTVHVVSRQKTRSSWDGWLDLRYQRRAPGGGWNAGYLLAAPTKWNWNVGVADDGRGHVHLMSSNHGGGGSVWADLRFFTDAGGAPADVGRMSNVYRVDYEARLRGHGGRVYFASSNSFTSSSAYFSHATGGAADLAAQLAGNLQQLRAGSGSNKGFPDMAIDGLGNVHYTYGSGYTNHSSFPGSTAGCVQGEVHYVRFDASGNRAFPMDRTLFTNLGVWHLSIGLSAVGVSDDGSTVVAVALRSPDHKEAGNSELLWAVSRDGGASWSEPQSLGVRAFGGEGRQRPRLVALGSKFFLFYKANGTVGTSLAMITFPEARPRAPSDLVATPVGGGIAVSRIQPCWRDNASDEDGYALERREEGGTFAEVATTGPNISCYNDLRVEPGRAYAYRVRAVRRGVYSTYSNEASATAPELPPPPPSDAGFERDAGDPSVDAGRAEAPDGGTRPSPADAGAPDARDPVDRRTMAGGCAVDGGGACWGAWLLLLARRRR